MAEQNQHHRHRDGASKFKERSLRAITRNRLIDKYLKVSLFVLAIIMMILVAASYVIG
jgi:uncharacterized membrane protein